MASSRWKRFAFFDRRNLSLPQPVIDDILQPNLSPDQNAQVVGNNRSAGGSNRNNGSIYQTEAENDVLGKGECVSLAVTNGGGIPFASLSENKDPSASMGVKGMYGTLSACAEDGTNPPTTTENQGSFQFSPSGQPLSVPNDGSVKLQSHATKRGNVEGSLILAFVSSRAVENVHCVDLTMRCNPINHVSPAAGANEGGGGGSSGGGGGSSGGGGGTNREKYHAGIVKNTEGGGMSIKNDLELEDLDGWRGYFQPFAHGSTRDEMHVKNSNPVSSVGSVSTATVTTASKSPDHRIIGIAVCSNHQTPSGRSHNIYVACITDSEKSVGVTVHRNPHLYLNGISALEESSRANINRNNNTAFTDTPSLRLTPKVEIYQPGRPFDYKLRGNPRCVDISHRSGVVVVGTDNGMVLVYRFNVPSTANAMAGRNGTNEMSLVMEIQAPLTASLAGTAPGGYEVTSVKLISENNHTKFDGGKGKKKGPPANSSKTSTKVFVAYRRSVSVGSGVGGQIKENTPITKVTKTKDGKSSIAAGGGGGVCCYDLGVIADIPTNSKSAPSARYDLDGRDVMSTCLCDVVINKRFGGDSDAGESERDIDNFMVARPDGLYTYSSTDKVSVSPIDGTKIAMCSIPPQIETRKRFYVRKLLGDDTAASKVTIPNPSDVGKMNNIKSLQTLESGASYVLVATTDSKSGRDAVDIYDATNKLVAFHLLLSPGHKALRVAGVTALSRIITNGSTRGGLSSAVVLTSGGSIVTLTEKVTSEKVALLVHKNLYLAAISMAFADPAYQSSDITALYRRHAEHLYRKGDFSAAMDQYVYTIGSLEPSHVIFRYLDAPKIPLLAKYLEELRSRELATPKQNELLRTCYLKLNDVNAAEKISASLSKAMDSSSCVSLVSKLLHSPTEALTTICSLDPPQAAEALTLYGDTFARALPRETAGVVISLCDGTYCPAGQGGNDKDDSDEQMICQRYPVDLFSSAFLENPKLLRVILARCYKNKRILSPSLKRTLLELTLEEWNNAKRTCDMGLETKRRAEAISILTDSHSSDLGEYEALVIVQLAGFSEGEVMIYERLQMAPMLVEKYAKDGTYRARRQMLAMCRSDPELLADVLGHFVTMVSEKIVKDGADDTHSVNSESEIGEMLDDIKEALSLARAQGVLPPVRIARILAGDGVGQFSNERSLSNQNDKDNCVPLSVALDYIGAILDESSTEISRLRNDVQEYSQMCNSMETEILELLAPPSINGSPNENNKSNLQEINIEEMYSTLIQSSHDHSNEKKTEASSEEFWREMGHSEDRFETIARFFAKGIID